MPPDKPIPAARDERYDAQRVEEKWAARWLSDPSLYAAEAHPTKPKYYVLEMLPYPSGALPTLRRRSGRSRTSRP